HSGAEVSPSPSSSARFSVSLLRVAVAMRTASFSRRMTRASDEPIRPMPMRAILLKWTVDIVLLQKFGQGGDYAAIGFFRSDRHAQGIGEAVTADTTQNIAASGKPFVSLISRVCGIIEQLNQQEVRDRGCYPEA